MSIIRCNQPCRYQKDGYCRLKGGADLAQREEIQRTGCGYFAQKKEG